MHIERMKIHNFKGFRDFEMDLNTGVNIIVGNNEAGKSTIIEAIHLALTGILNGRYLKNELSQHLFNNDAVNEYISALSTDATLAQQARLPYISIELFLQGEGLVALTGDGNGALKDGCGISYKICFNEKYKAEYEAFVKSKSVKTLPIEYYDVVWESFARESITARSIPLKSALIDSSSNRYQNGADVYISRIIRDILEDVEIINVAQAHRNMKDVFMDDESVKTINAKLKAAVFDISSKNIELSVDMSAKNAWETTLTTYLDSVPFHYVGKGEQAIVKTKIALTHKKAINANVILLEEPENHLSHTKLSRLILAITKSCENKQIIISTHNSFVANKLGLRNLLLLDNKRCLPFSNLLPDTYEFFKKLAGYNTLRLLLCKKAILVEGDSDELIYQKAYWNKYGRLPIEDEIDVISVGTAFLRFLEIAKIIGKPVHVITDNDGDIENKITRKYSEYLGESAPTKEFIKICYDANINTGELPDFNYNTLEPNLVKSIGLQVLNGLFDTSYTADDYLHKYMKANKTECALKIFDSTEKYTFPQYILDAID